MHRTSKARLDLLFNPAESQRNLAHKQLLHQISLGVGLGSREGLPHVARTVDTSAQSCALPSLRTNSRLRNRLGGGGACAVKRVSFIGDAIHRPETLIHCAAVGVLHAYHPDHLVAISCQESCCDIVVTKGFVRKKSLCEDFVGFCAVLVRKSKYVEGTVEDDNLLLVLTHTQFWGMAVLATRASQARADFIDLSIEITLDEALVIIG